MKTFAKIYLVPLVLCFFVAGAHGAVDAFLKIDGIEGDSTDETHPNEIVALSFKIGVVQHTALNSAVGGISTGRPEFKPLTIFKSIDKASPKLFMACASGKHFANATLVVRKAGENPVEFFKVVLTDVLISSLNEDADTTDREGNPVETVALSYSKIVWTFTPQNTDGSLGTGITGGFDFKTNKVL